MNTLASGSGEWPDALVIGGGSAGLASAYHLQRRGLKFAVLEAARTTSGAWPEYYDSLRLFTPARHSGLPGLPFPGDPQRYPARDEVSAYLRAYAAYFAFPTVSGAEVVSVRPSANGFEVSARDGRVWRARRVISASGTFRRPHWPSLPGMAAYGGRLLHSAEYRRPEAFAGQRVVVLGAGNSAAQIAAELGHVATVTLAVRRPPRVIAQRPLGLDLTDWLTLSGIEKLPLGALGRLPDVQPVIAVPGIRTALAAGRPDIRPMFSRFTPGGVVWQEDKEAAAEEKVDSVIFATGYGWNGAYLPAAALHASGEPRQRSGQSTALPGLYFVGLPGQRTVASGTLRAAGPDAEAVVRHLASSLSIQAPSQSTRRNHVLS